MSRIWLGLEYVNYPETYQDGTGNWDLGSSENPSGNTCNIVARFKSADEAQMWFDNDPENHATCTLSSLRGYGESVYRRAQRLSKLI